MKQHTVTTYVGALALTLWMVFLGNSNLRASHIMGGDITYVCLAQNQYSFQLKLYRDCNGISLGTTETVTFTSSCTTLVVTLNLLAGYPQIVTPLCPTEQDACNQGSGGTFGIEEYIYKGFVTLPPCANGNWTVNWASCCRNSAITTLANGGSTGFNIKTTFNTNTQPCNSSPNFLTTPTPYFCAGQPVFYNHGASDPDNDSLTFKLVNCSDDNGGPVTYAGTLSGTKPLLTTAANPVVINAQTGAISFVPVGSVQQVGVICVLVEEYRNGVKIGSVVRDIQFTVRICSSKAPIASAIDGTFQGTYNTTACANDPITFNIFSKDPDTNALGAPLQNISMSWNGGIKGASFVVNTANPPAGTFTWSPTNADAGSHIFTVTVEDDACPIKSQNVFTYFITVEERPFVDAGLPQILCGVTDSVILTATVGQGSIVPTSYEWSPSIGLSAPFSPTTAASPDATTTYLLTAFYANGCISKDSVIVDFTNGVSLPQLADTAICSGSVVFDATASGGAVMDYSFRNDSLRAIPDFDPKGAYSYIQVSGVAPAAINNSIERVCFVSDILFGGDLQVYLRSPDNVLLELTTGNGSLNPYAGVGDTTCFSPTATVSIATAPSPFNAGPYLPEGSFSTLNNGASNGLWALWVSDNSQFINGNLTHWSIKFKDVNVVSYDWSPKNGTLSCTNCSTPTASPTATTTYTVVGSNLNGCVDTATVDVVVVTNVPAPIVSCQGVSSSSVTFCWGSILGVSGYEVSLNNGISWVLLAAADTCYTVTGLVVNQTVSVLVRGVSPCLNATIGVGGQACTTLPCTLTGSLVSVTNTSCGGAADGVIEVTWANGYSAPIFTIAGIGSQSSGIFSGLLAGNYVVTVSDSVGCSVAINATVNQPTLILPTVNTIAVSCNGGNNGTATVSATGGNGNFTFNWSNGDAGTLADTLAAGTYTVTVTDGNGCTAIGTAIIAQPTPLTYTTTLVNINCNGGNDGSISFAANGGSGSYEYSIDGGVTFSTNNTFSNLTAGTYTPAVRNAAGGTCLSIGAGVTLLQNAPIGLTTVQAAVGCNGGNNGAATVTAIGGTNTYTYNWSASANNQTIPTATGLTAGAHSVTVTDANGCTATAGVVITEPTALVLAMSSEAVSCHNATDGSLEVAVSGGTFSYSYVWNTTPAQTLSSATGLAAGTYTVTVTDGNNCVGTSSATVASPTPIVVVMTVIPESCNGSSDGSATVAASGGVGGFSYSWSNGDSTQNPIGLTSGTYTVTATDANGCTQTGSVIITAPSSLTLNTTGTNISCFGGNDGTAAVGVNGGTTPYTYSWQPGGFSTPSLTGLTAATYIVTVVDAKGCTAVDSVVLTQPAQGVSTIMSFQPLLCNADGSGTATVTATGGAGNYTYIWNTLPPQTTATATNLQAGTYTVTVTDGNGCSFTNSVTVTEPTPVAAIASASPVACNGGNDGSATAQPTGGMGSYSFAWNTTPIQTTATAANLSAGTYTVTVTDANGCSATATAQVTEPIGININLAYTEVSCNGGKDGTAVAIPSFGAGGYVFAWGTSPVQTTSTATNLSAGSYVVTVTDQNGCSATASITVTQPTALSATVSVTPVSCNGGNDGNATAQPSGGLAPYSYLWNPTGQTTKTITGLTAGTYQLTVTDKNGCLATTSATVVQPLSAVTVVIVKTDAKCFGRKDGAALALVGGGAGSHTFAWSNGSTTSGVSNLPAGTYDVTVTDANGCSAVATTTIDQPAPIALLLTQTPSSCYQGNDGTAAVLASGGVPDASGNYNYTWNTFPPQSSQAVTALTGGQQYRVTVTDQNNCFAIDSIVISQPPALRLATQQTNISCSGYADGEALVTPLGGTPGYTYRWGANAANATTPVVTNLTAGSYVVTVTDYKGCEADTALFITQPLPLAISLLPNPVLCKGAVTGSARALAAGGTPWYNFQWETANGVQSGVEINNLAAGTYAVTLTDANACTLTDSVTIIEPSTALTATLAKENVSCFGDRDGRIFIEAVGGRLPYQYSLNAINYTNANQLVGLLAGTYTVYVKDDLGCQITDSITLNEPREIIIDAGLDLTVEFGKSVRIKPDVQHARPPMTYQWLPSEGLSCDTCAAPFASPAYDTHYEVIVTDAKGCTASDEVLVRVKKVRRIYLATAFSPNNDGVNDALFVQGGDGTQEVLSFNVYDRWGEIIYQAANTPLNDPTYGWNGTFAGTAMNGGVFGWSVEVLFTDGEVLMFKGNTTLVR